MSIPTRELAQRLFDARWPAGDPLRPTMDAANLAGWLAVAEAARDGMRTSAQALCEAQAEIDSLRARAEACHDALVAEKAAHAATRDDLARIDAARAAAPASCGDGWPDRYGAVRWTHAGDQHQSVHVSCGLQRIAIIYGNTSKEAMENARLFAWTHARIHVADAFSALAAAWRTAEQAISMTASESAAVHARSTALFARLTKAEQEAADQRDRLTGLERDTAAFSEANQRQRAIIEHLRSKLINVSNADLDREIAGLATVPIPHAAERADTPTSPESPRPVVP